MSKSYPSAFSAVCLFTAALLNLVLLNSAIAQSNLPRCQGDYFAGYWSNCFGTARYPNGDRYEGEWRDDKQNGRGTYSFLADNRFKGDRYEGEHRDDKKNGRGTYYHASGDRYEGEFRDDKKNGRGTFYHASGDRYEGEYRDDKKNGRGTSYYASGDRYEGEYRDGERNGRGTYYHASGKVTAGFWQYGKYVGTTALADNTTSNTTSTQATSNRVRMVQSGGIFKVPVRLNDQLTLDFMVDSGASDVTVPADVVMTLIRTKTITDSDFRGEQVYVLADGSRVKSRTFILRSLRVGNQTVQNVEASVADIKGSLLLGQSFLRRFKTWSIDNTTNELVLQ